MTLSPLFTRSGALFAAVLTSATLLIGAPAAHAASKVAFYEVKLTEAAPAKKSIIRGVVFQCEGTLCRAPITGSAAKNVCISVARELGEVASFKAGERLLSSDEMAACNVKKKVNIARD
jgi:hypothetical protein